MTLAPEHSAQAFSGHRFAEAYPHLADDVHWILVGGPNDHRKAGGHRPPGTWLIRVLARCVGERGIPFA